jgi:hypothetical protein
MKRKYREAMRAQLRLQDSYIEGMSEDDAAMEAQDWHDTFSPPYQPAADRQPDEQQLPF